MSISGVKGKSRNGKPGDHRRRGHVDGRRAGDEKYDENDEDVEFCLDPDAISMPAPAHPVTYKPRAHWTKDDVHYVDDALGDTIVLCIPVVDGISILGGERWSNYYHTGVVPARPHASVNTGMAGSAKNVIKIEWIVDSGAGCHIASKK